MTIAGLQCMLKGNSRFFRAGLPYAESKLRDLIAIRQQNKRLSALHGVFASEKDLLCFKSI